MPIRPISSDEGGGGGDSLTGIVRTLRMERTRQASGTIPEIVTLVHNGPCFWQLHCHMWSQYRSEPAAHSHCARWPQRMHGQR
jgi:hypothetical protein